MPRLPLRNLIATMLVASPILVQGQTAVRRWSVDTAARIVIEGTPGTPFKRLVWRFTVGPSGALYAQDVFNGSFVKIAPDGTSANRIGRRGKGPGEFEATELVSGFVGDSFVVFDLQLKRLTYFLENGSVAKTLPYDLPRLAPYHRYNVEAFLDDGTVLGHEEKFDQSGTDHHWENPKTAFAAVPAAIAFIARPSETSPGNVPPTDTLTIVKDQKNGFPLFGGATIVFSIDQPWYDGDLFTTSPDGRMSVRVGRGAPETTKGSYTLTGFRRGKKAFDLRIPYTARPVDDALVNQWAEQTIGETQAETLVRFAKGHSPDPDKYKDVAAAREVFSGALYRPRFTPAVRSVVVGRDETIWIRREWRNAKTASWDVRDWSGKQIAAIDIPESLQMMAATRTAVWGVEKDADGNTIIVRYPVRLDK
jgi:hypothetical protein